MEGPYYVFVGADSTALGEGGWCLLCILLELIALF